MLSMSDLQSHPASDLAHTPLYDLHRALGARMIGFAGYDMPVHYRAGIIDEHLHTRRHAGLFDVSHMGQAILAGPQASLRLESLVPGDILGLLPGQMRYTMFLDHEGHILDDLIVSRLQDHSGNERLFLVANAATKDVDFARLAAALPDLQLTRRDTHALLSLQGPAAASVLARKFPTVETMTFLSIREFEHGGSHFIISRSGYTGEDGFEISLPCEIATAFAEELLAAPEVRPVGLGARDTLRLEAGLCLYGHDIDQTTDPVEAGLAWSISKRRRIHGGFPGASQIWDALAEGPNRRRIGLLLEGKAPAREGATILTPDGFAIGHLTSGGYAPSLGRPIGMGLIAAPYACIGNALQLDVRGKKLTATITAMPFVPHHYHRGN
jgi:aminomethyltransferase